MKKLLNQIPKILTSERHMDRKRRKWKLIKKNHKEDTMFKNL